jgi:hypothetical protein
VLLRSGYGEIVGILQTRTELFRAEPNNGWIENRVRIFVSRDFYKVRLQLRSLCAPKVDLDGLRRPNHGSMGTLFSLFPQIEFTKWTVVPLGAMTPLEALAILEAAVLECKTRDINTPEVREALDLLEPHIWPEWLIPQFRHHLERDPNVDVDKEDQQQVLRATFPGIRESVKDLLGMRIDALAREVAPTPDTNVKAEIGRLSNELAKLDQPWTFGPKRRSLISLLLHFLKRVRFRSTTSG